MATGTDPRKNFAPRILPWLLGIVAFVLYAVTLNHGVSLLNVVPVAKISGWTWQPEGESPLLYLVTYPFRWLPTSAIPVMLNLFAAACAAVTLGLLARSVSILAQDRTEEQRRRVRNDFGFLTLRAAWLPPVFAVAAVALQLSFWERATNFTGDTFDLLLFAFVVWSLLEYRLDEREGRLYLAALVYGAGITETYALLGFLPVFVAAVIWMRGWTFFNARFLSRMALFGAIGLLFYLVLPLISTFRFPLSFWQNLKPELFAVWSVAKSISVSDVRHTIAILSLTSLVPILLASIRWPSSFGDASRLGNALTTWMFHLAHALILFVCAWVMFDPPFSPRSKGYGLPCLPFYFLAALSIGYYAGYFLLVFRNEPELRSRTRREAGNPAFLGPTATAAVAIFAGLAVVGLVYKNFGAIRAADGDALGRYGALVEKSLPAGGILLCDSDTPGVDAPWRLFAVESVLARDGKLKNYVPVDTTSLMYAGYHRYLHWKYPAVWPQLVNETDMGMVNPHALPTVLALLSKSNTVYYLHPSAGYYFEQFYLEPHGAVYAMNLLPENTIVPPLPDKDLMAMNEAFWADARGLVSSLTREISSDSFEAETNLSIGERLFAQFHITTPPDASAALAAMYLSRDLDYWGTILQRAGELEKAGDAFATAEKLNPQNQVAQINLAFNKTLRAGNPQPAQLDDATPNQQVDGPFDEPSYCFQTASSFVSSTFYKQAIASFERVRALAPGNLACRYMLAQLYLVFRHPDDALAALQEPMKQPQTFSLSADNSTQLNVLAAEAYFQKNDLDHGRQLLDLEISRHPTDTNLLTAAAQAYVVHGLYHSALSVINRRLASAPDDATWLFGKGYVEMQMTNYDGAIASLDRVLELQTNNNDALFSRATAYLKSGRLDAARADYLRLQRVVSNSPPVAYGLGEIAWRRHETNDAVRNYEIFLAGANTNSPEAREVADRLADLKR